MYDFGRDHALLDEDLDEYRVFNDPEIGEDAILERIADLQGTINVLTAMVCILVVLFALTVNIDWSFWR